MIIIIWDKQKVSQSCLCQIIMASKTSSKQDKWLVMTIIIKKVLLAMVTIYLSPCGLAHVGLYLVSFFFKLLFTMHKG